MNKYLILPLFAPWLLVISLAVLYIQASSYLDASYAREKKYNEIIETWKGINKTNEDTINRLLGHPTP